jgi:hypothetical protein
MDTLCGYLRIYRTHLTSDEVNIRIAAQEVIRTYYTRPLPEAADHPWCEARLNLAGAILVDFDLSKCHVFEGDFRRSRFLGATANFSSALFYERPSFDHATFKCSASFAHAFFNRGASYYLTSFQADISFRDAYFTGPLEFDQADLSNRGDFDINGIRFF